MCPCNYHLRNSCVWVYMQVCVQVSLITCSGWNKKMNSWCYCYANSALWKEPFRDCLYVLCVCVCPLVLSICGHVSSGDSSRTARLCILINDDYLHPFQYNLYVSYYLRAFPYFSEWKCEISQHHHHHITQLTQSASVCMNMSIGVGADAEPIDS